MRSRAFIVTASLALAMSAAAIPARAAQTVWSGLVIAENVDQPSPIPSELSGIEQTLKDLFGYNQFQIIGQSRKTLKTGEEDWLAASKYFALHVDAQGESEAGYAVNLKLYKEKELLLETDTKLSRRSPLVVKGPLIGNGQLLLVLVVEGEASTGQNRSPHPSNHFVSAWRHLSHAIRDLMP
jgi:opacity protein-like surface antigen